MPEETEDTTGLHSSEKTENSLKPWQFQKGQSGNPSGRRKGTINLTNLLRKRLREQLSDEDRRMIAEEWVDRFIVLAAKDAAAAGKLLDRIDGPVTVRQEVSGPNGGPIVLQWPSEDDA